MKTVQSIDRALAVLFEAARRPGGLADLARRVNLPTSTTGRLLATLEAADTVSRDADGKYHIGPAIVAMANAASAAPSLEVAARHHLSELADVADEAAGLSVPIGDDILAVVQLDAPKSVRAEDWTGQTWPLHQGCSGIVILATFAIAERADYIERRTEIDLDADAAAILERRLRKSKAEGVAWSHGDYAPDLSSVAAPVLDADGRATAALYVYGPTYRFPGEATAELEALVRSHATQLSVTMQGSHRAGGSGEGDGAGA